MQHCLYVLQLWFIWQLSVADGLKCPEGQILHDVMCFYGSKYKNSFSGANEVCRRMGCFQPVITGKEMNDFLETYANDNMRSVPWIGLSSRNGTLIWGDGTPLKKGDYTNWAPGMPPSTITEELCAWMDLISGIWYLSACKQPVGFYYFCECYPIGVTRKTSTTSTTTVQPTTRIITKPPLTTSTTTKPATSTTITAGPSKTTGTTKSTDTTICADRFPDPLRCHLYKVLGYCTDRRWYHSLQHWCAKTCDFCACTDRLATEQCNSMLISCNTTYMKYYCMHACGYCSCYDTRGDCEAWKGFCNVQGFKAILETQCRKTCNACIPMNLLFN